MALFSVGDGETTLLARIGTGGGSSTTVIYDSGVVIEVDDDPIEVVVNGEEVRGRLVVWEGDRSKPVRVTLYQEDGVTPFDLTGWTLPTFVLREGSSESPPTVDYATAVIEDPSGGVLRYDWGAGETDTPGTYLGHFRAADAGGLTRHFGPIEVYIRHID